MLSNEHWGYFVCLAQHSYLKLHSLLLNLAPISTFVLDNLWKRLILIISSFSAITWFLVCTKHHAALVRVSISVMLYLFASYHTSYHIITICIVLYFTLYTTHILIIIYHMKFRGSSYHITCITPPILLRGDWEKTLLIIQIID